MQDERYANNPAWADVQPIPQDDGANPLVPIAYSRECECLILCVTGMQPGFPYLRQLV